MRTRAHAHARSYVGLRLHEDLRDALQLAQHFDEQSRIVQQLRQRFAPQHEAGLEAGDDKAGAAHAGDARDALPGAVSWYRRHRTAAAAAAAVSAAPEPQ